MARWCLFLFPVQHSGLYFAYARRENPFRLLYKPMTEIPVPAVAHCFSYLDLHS